MRQARAPADAPFVRTYGPQGAPLEDSCRSTLARWGYRPFHGIISRGLLLDRACATSAWDRLAPHLDDLRDRRPTAGDPEMLAVLRSAERHGVLTYDATLAVATDIARSCAADVGDVRRIELCNPKEGHTSSVWRIRVIDSHGECAADVAANVPRDQAAQRELLASAEQLERAGAAGVVATPVRVVQRGDLAVLVQPWLDRALEINPVRGPHGTRLAAVTDFLTEPGQSRVRAVLGRPLTDEEHVAVGTAAARVHDAHPGLSYTPRDGDWVLHESRPVLVACDPEPAAPHALLDPVDHVDAGFGLTDPAARAALRLGASTRPVAPVA